MRYPVILTYSHLDNELIIDIIPGQFVDGGEPLELDQPGPGHGGGGGAVNVRSVIWEQRLDLERLSVLTCHDQRVHDGAHVGVGGVDLAGPALVHHLHPQLLQVLRGGELRLHLLH